MPQLDGQIAAAIETATAEVRKMGTSAPVQSVLLMSQGHLFEAQRELIRSQTQTIEAIRAIPACPFLNGNGRRERIKQRVINITVPAVTGAGALAIILELARLLE